jgi:hypothetical protein
MFDNLTEFVDYLINNKQQYLIELLAGEINFNDSKSIIENYDLICNFVSENIIDYAAVTNYCVSHEGGDESIYENGIWETVLYEIHGWYFWKEPEGQTYGLFSNLEDALHYSGKL